MQKKVDRYRLLDFGLAFSNKPLARFLTFRSCFNGTPKNPSGPLRGDRSGYQIMQRACFSGQLPTVRE